MNEVKSLALCITRLSLSVEFDLAFNFPCFNTLKLSSQAYFHLFSLRSHLHTE